MKYLDKFLFLYLLVCIASYYLIGSFYYGEDFSLYLIHFNQKWDENLTYFIRVIDFLKSGKMIYNELPTQNKFYIQFVPMFFLSILAKITTIKYLPLFADLFFIFFNFIIINHLFHKVLKIEKKYSSFFSILVIIMFGVGIFSLNYFIRTFIFLELSNFPAITRQFSPSITFPILIGAICYLVNFFQKEKGNYFFLLVLVIVSYFVYPYNSIFFVIFVSIFSVLLFIDRKKINKKIIYINLFNFAFFLLWYFLKSETTNQNIIYSFGFNSILKFNNYMYYAYVFSIVNFLHYLIFKNIQFLIFLTFSLTSIVCENIKFVIGYDLQFYHFNSFITKPIIWINVLYLYYFYVLKINFKKSYELVAFLITLITILYGIAQFKFYNKVFLSDKDFIESQIRRINNFQQIKKIVQNQEVFTFSTDFILYGYRYSSAYNFIFFRARNYEIDSIENIKRFIDLCKYYNFTIDQCYKTYETQNNIRPDLGNNFDRNLYKYILLLHDGEFRENFRSLGKKYENINEFFVVLEEEYKNYDFNRQQNLNNKIFLIEKKYHETLRKKKKFINKKILFESQDYILYR